jgi:general secretion pathway protein G
MRARRRRTAFSLIELVVVVVIIALIGAIAIPKMSRGATGATNSSLEQDLSVLRGAMDLFNAEHPNAPLSAVATNGPAVVQCLTQCTDANAVTFSPTNTGSCIYGPYLRAMPAMPVGTFKGDNTITIGSSPGTGPSGWLFTGTAFLCNDPASDVDDAGNPYNGY